MSEHDPETAADEAVEAVEATPEAGDPVRTGVEEVDAVLESLEGLDDTPVDEHVAVFEAAHERLRRALDGRPDA